jgi:hypothetical protein
MEGIENLKGQQVEIKDISEKEISRLAKDFKKMVLKGTAGAMALPVAIVLSTSATAVATYFILKNKESVSGAAKKAALEIGDAAQKITQEAFDKIGIENPFKEKFHFGKGRSGGAGAGGEW